MEELESTESAAFSDGLLHEDETGSSVLALQLSPPIASISPMTAVEAWPKAPFEASVCNVASP